MKYSTKLIIHLAVLLFIIAVSIFVYMKIASMQYVRGRTGIHCYKIEVHHKNIEYHLYFKTMKECLDSLE